MRRLKRPRTVLIIAFIILLLLGAVGWVALTTPVFGTAQASPGQRGPYAQTQEAQPPIDLSTGSGTIILSDGTLVNSASSSVTDLAPGDHVTRTVTVENDATYAFSTLSLAVTDQSPTRPLTTGLAPLHLSVARCANTCTPLTISGNLGMVISNLLTSDLNPGQSVSLQITQTLDANAPPIIKGDKASLVYSFEATQRLPTTITLPPLNLQARQ